MILSPYFSDPLWHDLAATAITFAAALTWLRLMDAAAHRGWLSPRLSRKVIHIGTGPLFVLCWTLFSEAEWARGFAALVPLAITAQFALVGLGVLKDPAAVQGMSRTGNPREILRGPLMYGVVFVLATLVFWHRSPAGIMALMLLCGGDGLADIVGRRWGRARLPWSPGKSWAGSFGMFAGSFAFALGFVALFNTLGYFNPRLGLENTVMAIGLVSLTATAVESLPVADWDNVTVFLTAVIMAWLLVGPLGMWQAAFLA